MGTRVASVLAPKPFSSSPVKIPGQEPEVSYKLQDATTKNAAALHKGVAAGEEARSWGVWANGALSLQGNTSNDADSYGTVVATMLGVDYLIADRVLLGLAVGYDHSWLKTDFNNGSFYSNGLTFSPYLGVSILDELVLDVTGAVAFVSNHGERSTDTLNISGNYQSLRTMISSTLNYYYILDNWSFNAYTGFMYANEAAEGYTEKGLFNYRNRVSAEDTYVGEWSFGGRVGYSFDWGQPYIGLAYLWDPWMSGPDSLDNDELEATIGVNFSPSDVLSISLEVNHSFLREYVQSTTFMCTARYMF